MCVCVGGGRRKNGLLLQVSSGFCALPRCGAGTACQRRMLGVDELALPVEGVAHARVWGPAHFKVIVEESAETWVLIFLEKGIWEGLMLTEYLLVQAVGSPWMLVVWSGPC